MKKIVVLISFLFLLCGCGKEENRLVKDNYLDKNTYQEVHTDLTNITKEVSFIPSKDNERKFYEMIEVIRDNCEKFSKDELGELYNLANNNYQFIYSGKRYNDSIYQNDLQKIKVCIEGM